MSLLDSLFRSGALRALDHALAQALRRLDPATPDAVLAGAALASLAVGSGHAAFDPARPWLLLDGTIEWPQAQPWLDSLSASRWVTLPAKSDTAATDAPLVLDGGLLYLRRYREYERRLAARLQGIAAHPPAAGATTSGDVAALAPLFAALFPQAHQGDDRQARVAALALRRSLLLVTGGPGTGKTTTITRLLVLLVAQARLAGAAPPRIALAAPTGRAAERMAGSLRNALAQLRDLPGVDRALCDELPASASTLHRLLGTLPDSPRFRHDAAHPLPVDVVIVDEASMVDLPLMCKLVEAVPDGARLVLLGDPDQLPSVEAGDVLAGILAAAGAGDALSVDDAHALAALIGEPAKVAGDAGSGPAALAGHRVQLQRGYRQAEVFHLAPLANAVRDGDADRTLALLRGGELAGVHFHEDLADPLDDHRDVLLGHWRELAAAATPADALARAGELRLLTALRDGPQGARGLNARIEDALLGRTRGNGTPFHGRLLQITENSYRHRLFNGDIGICLRDGNGALVAWFADGSEAGVRGFHPAALPAHEGAFVTTVHKAQGSEFDAVWLQLPRQDSRVLSRELVYTALTRARRELHVCASEAVLRAALSRHAQRVSGLARRLA
ncbi:exodeoxyribonuclease V subunit alpha [Montanilutibacter psychrotolerans]|uniref:RecBCD enzyme subunit RecD n=1 Tax=Montanilutibacter psychrotolerans TaxID=1327343 RepID=A0A3M8SWQ5_9GAMM|nr:exodeoxyribonuclease V subunit alpha [Lysobacter psychrotolerans]RNF83644.1 exodeoxyribonuclease V subunit alpha [Lysobacter psychrotolerans]